jgi:hypothetical protein
MIVRCRKCWVDVAIQRADKPVQPCPKCGAAETYFHAMVTQQGKKEKPDGPASPG